MVADAAHSLGDMVSDVVTLVALRFGRQPTGNYFFYYI